MTIQEFHERYHDYKTDDFGDALSDSLQLNVVDENGQTRNIVPVKIGGVYCLMLDTAASLVKQLYGL